MAWQIPSLSDVTERTRASFATYLSGVDATVFPSNVYVAAKVIAARVWELFHRQDYIAKQAFPLTAEGTYLERHGQALGISRKVEIHSGGYITLDGGTHTTEIPAGTTWQAGSGAIYESQSVAYIDDTGSATIYVVSQVAGAGYEEDGGTSLTMQAVIAGAPASATVASDGIYGGSDIESDAELRARILFRLRYPPHAGSEADYIRWASEVDGVTRVFVEGNAFGAGTVGVWPMMDAKHQFGIPNAADIANIQAHLDSVKPITAQVTVSAPMPDPVGIEITGLYPVNTKVINAVKAELQAMIESRSEVSTNTAPFVFRRSWVWQAVANATGEQYHTVTLPADDYVVPAGRMPVYDSTFVKIGG